MKAQTELIQKFKPGDRVFSDGRLYRIVSTLNARRDSYWLSEIPYSKKSHCFLAHAADLFLAKEKTAAK